MGELERISVSIEPELLRRFDDLLRTSGQANRSEAIRDLIRARLVDEDSARDESDVAATLTILYEHHRREFAQRLLDVGHQHTDFILATLHVHLDHDHCLEVIALKGQAKAVRDLADRMLHMKGVEHGRLVVTSPDV